MADEKTDRGSCIWLIFGLILLIGASVLVIFAIAFAKTTYETGVNLLEKVDKFANDPFYTVKGWFGWNHKPLRVSKIETDRTVNQTAQASKNMMKLKNSMETHIELIQKRVAHLTIGEQLGELQQEDSDILDVHVKKMAREGRHTGSLFVSSAQDAAILAKYIKELYPESDESDLEYRQRFKDGITVLRRKMNSLRELNSNTTLQIRIFKDTSFEFKDLLSKKRKKYGSIHDANAPSSTMRRIAEIGSAFCAGATAGASTGIYFAWAPPVAAAASGIGSMGAGLIAAGWAYFDSQKKQEISQESLETMVQIDGMDQCTDGMIIYLGKAESGYRAVDSELSDAFVDIDKLEVTNSPTRVLGSIERTFADMNQEYENTILSNKDAIEALKPLEIQPIS